jgi:hypothetical protein
MNLWTLAIAMAPAWALAQGGPRAQLFQPGEAGSSEECVRPAKGGERVGQGEYAQVTYVASSTAKGAPPVTTAYFGPGQVVASSLASGQYEVFGGVILRASCDADFRRTAGRAAPEESAPESAERVLFESLRGVRLPARLAAAVGPHDVVRAKVTRDVRVDGRVVVPVGSWLTCASHDVEHGRLAFSCHVVALERPCASRTCQSLVAIRGEGRGRDERAGLPLLDPPRDAAVALVGGASAGGDVVASARVPSTRVPTVPEVPAGTEFDVVLTEPAIRQGNSSW